MKVQWRWAAFILACAAWGMVSVHIGGASNSPGLIAFERNVSGEPAVDIVLTPSDSYQPALLVESARSPQWSPDGGWVAFITTTGGHLGKIRSDGSGLVVFENTSVLVGAKEYQWTDSSHIIAATYCPAVCLAEIDMTSGSVTQVYGDAGSWDVDDGLLIHTCDAFRLCLSSLPFGDPETIFEDPNWTINSPTWSTDGASIAWIGPGNVINVVDADGTDRRQAAALHPSAGGSFEAPSWSLDSSMVVAPYGGGSSFVQIVSVMDTPMTSIEVPNATGAYGGNSFAPRQIWSPDSMAFVAEQGGQLATFDAATGALVANLGPGMRATWRPVDAPTPPATPGPTQASGEDRKVIFIQGIDSKSDNLNCEHATSGFLDSGGSNRISWMSEYLIHNNQVRSSVPSLDSEDDFLYVSHSGQYCPPANGDFHHPRYEKIATCGGVEWGANQLNYIVQSALGENSNTTFDLVGHSMGGLVASYWLAMHPEVRSHINSVTTFDSPLRGLAIRNWITSDCSLSKQSWKDLDCDEWWASDCESDVVTAIAVAGELAPFYTIDSTQKDNHLYPLQPVPVEFVPADRTTLLSSNSRVHCKFDDDHSSVWEEWNLGGTDPIKCWRDFRWPGSGPSASIHEPDLYRASAAGGSKESFLACAITHLAPDDCLASLGEPVIPDGVIDGLFPAGSIEIEVKQSTIEIGDIIQINPGMPNEETRRVVGLGSLILDGPLSYDHSDGERIVKLGHIQSPTTTSTPSGPPSSATPVPTPTGGTATTIHGDTNCDTQVNTVDALNNLLEAAGVTQDADCLSNAGDIDCDHDRDAVDALGILKYTAQIPAEAAEGCAAIGNAL